MFLPFTIISHVDQGFNYNTRVLLLNPTVKWCCSKVMRGILINASASVCIWNVLWHSSVLEELDSVSLFDN